MSIQGLIVLEDATIQFTATYNGTVYAVINDLLSGETETIEVPQDKFFKALAIAVHNAGEPDFRVDYPDAESIQGKIRWIP